MAIKKILIQIDNMIYDYIIGIDGQKNVQFRKLKCEMQDLCICPFLGKSSQPLHIIYTIYVYLICKISVQTKLYID